MHKVFFWSCCNSIFKYGGCLYQYTQRIKWQRINNNEDRILLIKATVDSGIGFPTWKSENSLLSSKRDLIITESYSHTMEPNLLVLSGRILRPREVMWFTLWSHSKIRFFWFPWQIILVWVASNLGYWGQWKYTFIGICHMSINIIIHRDNNI